MKKILTLIIIMFISATTTLVDAKVTNSSTEEIQIEKYSEKSENNSHHNGARAPFRVPLKCFRMENCLTVISEYEANMEITVTNNATGEIAAHEISDLTTSLSLYISDYTSGAMEVTIEMDGKTFVGYF